MATFSAFGALLPVPKATPSPLPAVLSAAKLTVPAPAVKASTARRMAAVFRPARDIDPDFPWLFAVSDTAIYIFLALFHTSL